MSEDSISLRAFAKIREVSLAAVQKAIASGRVKSVKRDGDRLVGVYPEAAMREWNGNTDLDQAARAGAPLLVQTSTRNTPATMGGDLLAAADRSQAAAEAPAPGSSAAAAAAPGSGAPQNDDFGYLESRAEKEKFQAKRAELDYLERVGTLVPVDAVREQQFSIFRKLRDNIIAIGSRLGPRLAAETDPVRVQHLIDEEHRKALHELSRALAVDASGGAGERPGTLQ